MINLKQSVGELSARKGKMTRKDSEGATPISTETIKRAKRGNQTPQGDSPVAPKKNGWVVRLSAQASFIPPSIYPSPTKRIA